MNERCRVHFDTPAQIVFEKAGKTFGYCRDCVRRMRLGTLLGLILGHGYTARRNGE